LPAERTGKTPVKLLNASFLRVYRKYCGCKNAPQQGIMARIMTDKKTQLKHTERSSSSQYASLAKMQWMASLVQ
jgi:hypothetical protein